MRLSRISLHITPESRADAPLALESGAPREPLFQPRRASIDQQEGPRPPSREARDPLPCGHPSAGQDPCAACKATAGGGGAKEAAVRAPSLLEGTALGAGEEAAAGAGAEEPEAGQSSYNSEEEAEAATLKAEEAHPHAPNAELDLDSFRAQRRLWLQRALSVLGFVSVAVSAASDLGPGGIGATVSIFVAMVFFLFVSRWWRHPLGRHWFLFAVASSFLCIHVPQIAAGVPIMKAEVPFATIIVFWTGGAAASSRFLYQCFLDGFVAALYVILKRVADPDGFYGRNASGVQPLIAVCLTAVFSLITAYARLRETHRFYKVFLRGKTVRLTVPRAARAVREAMHRASRATSGSSSLRRALRSARVASSAEEPQPAAGVRRRSRCTCGAPDEADVDAGRTPLTGAAAGPGAARHSPHCSLASPAPAEAAPVGAQGGAEASGDEAGEGTSGTDSRSPSLRSVQARIAQTGTQMGRWSLRFRDAAQEEAYRRWRVASYRRRLLFMSSSFLGAYIASLASLYFNYRGKNAESARLVLYAPLLAGAGAALLFLLVALLPAGWRLLFARGWGSQHIVAGSILWIFATCAFTLNRLPGRNGALDTMPGTDPDLSAFYAVLALAGESAFSLVALRVRFFWAAAVAAGSLAMAVGIAFTMLRGIAVIASCLPFWLMSLAACWELEREDRLAFAEESAIRLWTGADEDA
eukprot:tig00021318_g20155.t1